MDGSRFQDLTKKILVTGAAGFIGSHVADRLIQDENQVIAYDNLSQGDLKNLSRWDGNPLLSAHLEEEFHKTKN